MSQLKLSVVIPAYNEEKRIVPTLESIDKYLENKPYDYEIIVVANQCTDNTAGVVREYMKTVENLKLMNLENHCTGKGEAVKKGVEKAQGEYIMFMDADNATRIDEIDKFWSYFEEGYDVVIGSRHAKGANIVIEQPWYRRFLGRAANFLIQLILLPRIKDTQCGFKVFTHDVAKEIFRQSRIIGWGFDMEILAIARSWGYKIKEVPVSWYEAGKSRLRPVRASWRTLRELIRVKLNLMRGKYKKESWAKV